MDLALKPAHKAFADEVRAFARENLSPATKAKTFSGKHYDRDDHMVWQQALGRKGWLGITWPKEFGGQEGDGVYEYLLNEELARRGRPAGRRRPTREGSCKLCRIEENPQREVLGVTRC